MRRPSWAHPVLLASLLSTLASGAQTGTQKLSGTEPTQQIQWVRILTPGVRTADADAPPLLVAQCTKDATGKSAFEIRVRFHGKDDGEFHLPWRPSWPGHISPAPPEKVDISFAFSGYTTVKPMKRQWEAEREPEGEFRYLSPAFHSRNLEENSFFLQYMWSLPTLRLVHGADVAEFDSTAYLQAIHSEPLCSASGV